MPTKRHNSQRGKKRTTKKKYGGVSSKQRISIEGKTHYPTLAERNIVIAKKKLRKIKADNKKHKSIHLASKSPNTLDTLAAAAKKLEGIKGGKRTTRRKSQSRRKSHKRRRSSYKKINKRKKGGNPDDEIIERIKNSEFKSFPALHPEFDNLTAEGRKKIINKRHYHLLPGYERSRNQPDGPPVARLPNVHQSRKDSGIYSPTPPE